MSSVNLAGNLFPSNSIANRYGYRVVDEVVPLKLEIADLEPVPFLRNGEDSLDGEAFLQRAADLGANIGLTDANYFMSNQAKISIELRVKCLMFTGTRLQKMEGDDDREYIAYMIFRGDHWYLNFYPINHDNNWSDELVTLVRYKQN